MLLNNITPPPEIRHYLLEDDGYGNKRKKSNKENLQNAKKNKNDEFYTQLNTIENELNHYKSYFKNKIVFCNCDDYLRSQFFWYFAKNFNHLNLKKLITTSYNEKGAVRVIINSLADYNNDGAVDDVDIQIKLKEKGVVEPLGSNGDFRTPQSEALLKQADIVVTNPPFSHFRSFIDQIQKYKKKFLIIGNYNSVSYEDIFSAIQDNKIWLGVSRRGIDFIVPNNYEGNHKIGDDGKKYANVNAAWFTNLEHAKRSESLLEKIQHNRYDPSTHPTYDNFNAIEVNPVLTMPADFADLMGVPITYLPIHNPEEFELVGSNQYLDVKEGAFFLNNHKMYARLIIRNKQPQAPAHRLPKRDVSGWIHPKKREQPRQQQQQQQQQQQPKRTRQTRQRQMPQPQYDQDFMNKLTGMLGPKPRKRKQEYVWKISHPDNETIVPIVYGPDPEQGGIMTIWHEGDDLFEPHFERFYKHLVSQGLING